MILINSVFPSQHACARASFVGISNSQLFKDSTRRKDLRAEILLGANFPVAAERTMKVGRILFLSFFSFFFFFFFFGPLPTAKEKHEAAKS